MGDGSERREAARGDRHMLSSGRQEANPETMEIDGQKGVQTARKTIVRNTSCSYIRGKYLAACGGNKAPH